MYIAAYEMKICINAHGTRWAKKFVQQIKTKKKKMQVGIRKSWVMDVLYE